MEKQSCAYGVDYRYENSDFPVELTEYDMMYDLGLIAMVESLPSWFNYGGSDSLRNHEFKLFNRPTASWKIECDLDGDTREEAIKKTQI